MQTNIYGHLMKPFFHQNRKLGQIHFGAFQANLSAPIYRISSYKTRGHYFLTRLSNASIIRTRVLIKGWYYYQTFINLDIKTRKPSFMLIVYDAL